MSLGFEESLPIEERENGNNEDLQLRKARSSLFHMNHHHYCSDHSLIRSPVSVDTTMGLNSQAEERLMLKRTFFRARLDEEMMEDESDEGRSCYGGPSKRSEVLKLLSYEYYLSGDGQDEAVRLLNS